MAMCILNTLAFRGARLSHANRSSFRGHAVKRAYHGTPGGHPKFKLSSAVSDVSSSAKLTAQHVEHPAYELLQQDLIVEYGANAALYKHKKSGAQVLSVIAPDENKVFGAVFRTPPEDSTGIPHILEHSVLCGSRKFPVKEPFVDLMKGSLNTFLNAFTYPDRTCYPVASMNKKDFYNLIQVYLDAVFHPRAINDEQVLQQEGWHYELEDISKPLTYKGVVYNEMKGVYSSPESLMGRAAQNALFPENTYSVDSGGDPLVIPSLTFSQFQEFHAKYYHPSNSRLYFYGDDDPMKRLELLDEYLSEFDEIPVTSQIANQPRNLTPKKLSLPFPIGPDQPPKHLTTINWLLHDTPLSNLEQLSLVVLDHLLLGTSASILRKRLTESGLGESVSGGGLSDELVQSTFSVGMKGVEKEDVPKIEALILSTLEETAEKGFELEAIQASLNSIEFQLREFNTGSFPRGLSLMLGMMNHWIYDREPFDGVRFENEVKQLKQQISDGTPVFQDLLRRLFVDNTHRVTIDMTPDSTLEAKMEAEEATRLAELKAGMSPEQLEVVMETQKRLREAQEREDSPEARATLPKLTKEDLDRNTREIPSTQMPANAGGATMVITPVQSNGILYTDVGFDYSGIAVEDLPLLSLLGRLLTETGTEKMDEVTLSRHIGAQTGGVNVFFHSDLKQGNGVVSNPHDIIALMIVRGKATMDKSKELYDIMEDILLHSKIGNQKRAIEILKEMKARREGAVIGSGHSFGATRLAAKHSLLGYMNEVMGGVTAVKGSAALLAQAENDWPAFQKRLEALRDTIVKRGPVKEMAGGARMVVALSGEERVLERVRADAEKFVGSIPSTELCDNKEGTTLSNLRKNEKVNDLLVEKQNEGFVIPSQVNYVVKGGPLYTPGEPVKGSTTVVSRYLSTGYLWDTVRVMGGAYGGFGRFGVYSGRMSFLSYRDPNLMKTLNNYDGAAAALSAAVMNGKSGNPDSPGLDAAAILQAIIGTVGDLDSPLSPDQKGFTAFCRFLNGETPEDRQKMRNEILDSTPEDFAAFAEKLEKLKDTGTVVVFGSESAITAANSELSEDKKLKVQQALGSK
eukprot:CAMPEP_0182417672 /NCGR_PEP_ID=MMETSP1167-20130531/2113_1 /TAXON_ID=2988 /ORGANISM="Mallomonas Sp, Strain CCMP3275" /LENGTH=1082 /DNA_ID=CAMNT_0024591379 /DNA_START=84 /DNA_END=3332 /DNA_ORIENTATION=+